MTVSINKIRINSISEAVLESWTRGLPEGYSQKSLKTDNDLQ